MYNCVRCHNSHFTDEKMLCEDAGPLTGCWGWGSGDSTAPQCLGDPGPRGDTCHIPQPEGNTQHTRAAGRGAGWMRTCKRQGASAATAAVEHPQTVHAHTRARYSYGKPVSALLRCSASRSLALRCSPLTHEVGGPFSPATWGVWERFTGSSSPFLLPGHTSSPPVLIIHVKLIVSLHWFTGGMKYKLSWTDYFMKLALKLRMLCCLCVSFQVSKQIRELREGPYVRHFAGVCRCRLIWLKAHLRISDTKHMKSVDCPKHHLDFKTKSTWKCFFCQ